MTLKKQLQEVQDDQRSKSLDVREKAVAERERLLDDSERIIRIEVLDKTIEAKNDTIHVMSTKISSLENEYKGRREELARETYIIESNTKKAEKDLKTVQDNTKVTRLSLDSATADLHNTKKELEQTKQYIKEQADVVNDTVSEWNAQLVTLEQQAKNISHDKELLLKDIITLKRERQTIEEGIEVIETKMVALDDAYEAKAEDYREQLKLAKAKVTEQQQKLLQVGVDYKNMIDDIELREKAVKTKEAQLNKREFDLSQNEQRLAVRTGLIGL